MEAGRGKKHCPLTFALQRPSRAPFTLLGTHGLEYGSYVSIETINLRLCFFKVQLLHNSITLFSGVTHLGAQWRNSHLTCDVIEYSEEKNKPLRAFEKEVHFKVTVKTFLGV